MKIALLTLMLVVAAVASRAEPLTLAANGTTDYVIVSGTSLTDEFAVKELKSFLKQSTGTDFKRVPIEQAGPLERRIVVGNNSLSRKLLGGEVIDSLRPDESLVTVKGQDLILTGEGDRGASYAVYSFLERELGCRWFTAYGDSVVPKHETLTVAGLHRREIPAFKIRNISQSFYQIRPERELFFFRNRLNTLASSSLPALKSALPEIGPAAHTLFYYINPDAENNPAWAKYPYPPKNNFFATHPEFFSLNAAGARVKGLQLCFSNLELRKVITGQIEAVIQKTATETGAIALDANDVPGRFCHCPGCVKLEQHYETPGGPLLDYLIDLCAYLKEKHPGIYVKTLAYRKKQSEAPPKNIEKLPDNLIVVFAPIDDNFATPLDHPSNLGTLENLKQWRRLAKNVWVWYYTNPYITPNPPLGNLEKLVKDVRILRDCGVNGTYFEHDSGVATGYNFGELQTWLLLKLFYDPDQDAEKLVHEFTDYYYGPAAPLMRSYIAELEELRKEIPVNMPWNPSFSHFTFYNPERIMSWEQKFDQMEKLTSDLPDCLLHVRTSRIPLDITMLRSWSEIKERNPELAVTPKSIHARIVANFEAMARVRFPAETGRAHHWNLLQRDLPQILLQAEVEPKPLPKFFAQLPAGSVHRAFPAKKTYKDPEAACGIATGGTWEKTPVNLGLYDNANEKWLASGDIQRDKIKPDRYEFYKLGRTELTSHCLVWVTDGWIITVPVEQFYVVGEPFIQWEIYASLKFEGPQFGSGEKERPNRISCDQVVLVRAEPGNDAPKGGAPR